MTVVIETTNLRQFVKDVREVDAKIRTEVGREFKAIGPDLINKADALATSQGGVAAHVVRNGAMTASASTAALQVKLGNDPAAMGAEFGGGARPRTRQFKPHRGQSGYFLYPTIRHETEHIIESLGDAVMRAAAAAFPLGGHP